MNRTLGGQKLEATELRDFGLVTGCCIEGHGPSCSHRQKNTMDMYSPDLFNPAALKNVC